MLYLKIREFKTERAVHSSAAIYQNMVCFSCADGILYALDKANAKLAWKFASKGKESYGLWNYCKKLE
jgi:outer membrane protein assembly factor BamB